jgi:hypothetical protein
LLPEMLCLADYGLGDGASAKRPLPVARHFGPRFIDWQLAQTASESRLEQHIHAQNVVATEIRRSTNDVVLGGSRVVDKSTPDDTGNGRLF